MQKRCDSVIFVERCSIYYSIVLKNIEAKLFSSSRETICITSKLSLLDLDACR